MTEERPAIRDVADEVLAQWRDEFPEAAGLPLEISKRVGRLASILATVHEEALAPLGLQKAEFGVLSTLRRIGAPYRIKPAELARALLLSSGGLSNILRRLEEAGLVTRGADREDQRSIWVRLTREGVKVAEHAVSVWTAANTRALAPISDRTGRQIADLLREALVALGDTPPPEAPVTVRMKNGASPNLPVGTRRKAPRSVRPRLG